jgi:hypothetical protein
MSKPLIALVGLIYLFVAGEQLHRGNVPGFVLWASYAAANVGLFFMSE